MLTEQRGNACLQSQMKKACLLIYFVYLEGDSIMFPRPYVLCDCVLLSICEVHDA